MPDFKPSRVIILTGALFLLGLVGVVVSLGQELVAWSRVFREKMSGTGGPAPTTVPTLSAAALVTVTYVRARLGR